MNRRMAMGNLGTSGCALILFGSLVVFASAALAQPCTPVVYAFRHAEDTNPANPPGPIFALTPVGQAHAALYPIMVSGFQDDKFCPVTKVYATTKVNKLPPCGNACVNATNAFDTATPLAMKVMSANPITTVGNGVYQLYEYLGNGNDAPTAPNYSTATAIALRSELLATANLSQSSAIFWTSQGLHVLGGVIINGNSNVPVKNGGAIPPRNAAYIFVANGTSNITSFNDTPLASRTTVPSSVYLQCFNHVEASSKSPPNPHFIDPTGNPPTQAYYCGYGDESVLGGGPPKSCPAGQQCNSTISNDSTKRIMGKICDTRAMLPGTSGPGIFGACN